MNVNMPNNPQYPRSISRYLTLTSAITWLISAIPVGGCYETDRVSAPFFRLLSDRDQRRESQHYTGVQKDL